jgi:regulator of protease activity HflC (stomatin/prohibitin superfamily)
MSPNDFKERDMSSFIILLVVVGLSLLMSMVKVLSEWERGVILRLGNCIGVKGPGLILLIPVIDRMVRVDTRTVTMDVQPQDVITLDNVSMKVNAVVYFRVIDPEAAIVKIEDYYFAASQLTQTTLRSIMGQFQMDDILSQRDKINVRLQEILDDATEQWGVKVSNVEVKNIDLPPEMQRAMARQAEAERERRAKVISAEGELQRSEKLKQAAEMLAQSPTSMQLAYLQTLTEIADEGTNTIVFPLPLETVGHLFGKKPQ